AVQIRSPPFFVVETISAGENAYIRTMDGRVLRIDASGVDDKHAPGVCDALTVTSSGRALALIRDQGIFELDSDWKLRVGYPSGLKVGFFYYPSLAEWNGTIALSAYDKVWLSTNGAPLQVIPF